MIPFADLMSCMVILFLALFCLSYNMKRTDYEKALAMLQKEMGSKAADQKLSETEIAQKVEEQLKKEIELGNLGVEMTTTKVKLTFSSPVLFVSGSADIKPRAKAMLKPLADILKPMDNPVVVEGYTDSQRIIKGSRFGTNRELSAARAFSVIDFMVKQGLEPARFSAFGYGEYRPAAPNDTEEGRAKNRKIEVTILRKEAEEETAAKEAAQG